MLAFYRQKSSKRLLTGPAQDHRAAASLSDQLESEKPMVGLIRHLQAANCRAPGFVCPRHEALMLSLHHVEPFARRLDLSLPFLTAYLRLTVQRIVLCRAGTEDKASKLNRARENESRSTLRQYIGTGRSDDRQPWGRGWGRPRRWDSDRAPQWWRKRWRLCAFVHVHTK